MYGLQHTSSMHKSSAQHRTQISKIITKGLTLKQMQLDNNG